MKAQGIYMFCKQARVCLQKKRSSVLRLLGFGAS